MQARWVAEGDKCTKTFFKSFKSMASAKSIPSLLDQDRNFVSLWEEMVDVVPDFFR